MLSAIKEIGKWQMKNELNTLLQEPFKNGQIINILINLYENKFEGIDVPEEYGLLKRMKSFFRNVPSNVLNPAPTAKLVDPKKTFTNKINNGLKIN